MTKRSHQHDGAGRPDPLGPENESRDPVNQWAEELRGAVVAELDPADVTQLASVASAATAVGAASLATAAGVTTGAVTGGTTMTTLFGSTLAKIVATGALVAALGGGAAVTGNLPAGLQDGAADLASNLGIELPRPAVTIDVEEAGQLVVDLVDDVLQIVEVDAGAGWSAVVRSQADGAVVVDFVSDGITKTVTAVRDQAGSISTDVATSTDGSGTVDSGVDAEADATVDSESDIETPIVDGSVDVGVDVDTSVGIGLED